MNIGVILCIGSLDTTMQIPSNGLMDSLRQVRFIYAIFFICHQLLLFSVLTIRDKYVLSINVVRIGPNHCDLGNSEPPLQLSSNYGDKVIESKTATKAQTDN